MRREQSSIIPYFTGTNSRCKYPDGLYLVATPIGNLEDITLRALYTLNHVDKILCEDTRVTKKLLTHYDIKKELVSFHNYSDSSKIDRIIAELKTGVKFALVSDAGTPLISDPGFDLVKQCTAHNIYTTIIPGPCALIAGLALSTLSTLPFVFGGFLPPKSTACQSTLESFLSFSMTIIFYETALRLMKTLTILNKIAPHAQIAVVREITKVYESIMVNSASDLIKHYTIYPPRGEIVLLISPGERLQEFAQDWKEALKETMQQYSLTQSVKMISQTYNIPKNTVYTYALAHQKI